LGIADANHEDADRLRAFAAQAALPLSTFKRSDFSTACVAWTDAAAADAVLVYTFPHVVPEAALHRPRHGFLNFHFAPLPQYRGAEPVFWLLRNRVAQGAVTVHRMDARLDRGPIVLSEPVPISTTDTHGTHTARLGATAVQATLRLVALLDRPAPLPLVAQDEMLARTWPKPSGPDVSIDWEVTGADDVLALVRACNPWNKGAYTFLGGSPLRILLARASDRAGHAPPGTLQCSPDGADWDVACADGRWVRLDTVLLDTGFTPGRELAALGLRAGMRFEYPFRRA
jgi:methionyl-tRNA formyltransferase